MYLINELLFTGEVTQRPDFQQDSQSQRETEGRTGAVTVAPVHYMASIHWLLNRLETFHYMFKSRFYFVNKSIILNAVYIFPMSFVVVASIYSVILLK